MCVCVCVCVRVRACVYAPDAIKFSGVILALYDWLNNSGWFPVPFYDSSLAVDVINRHGPSNKMCHQLQARKTKVRLY